jgi:cobalt-zinc-cadmium efflux system outer membrane protein
MNAIHYIQLTRATILLAAVLASGIAWSPPALAATATEVEPGSLIADAGQSGNAGERSPATEPEPVHDDTVASLPEAGGPEGGTPGTDSGPAALGLDDAMARALAAHPGLAALDKEYWALDGIAWQEGRRPNPELELELEEFGGTQEALGVRAMATTLTYTQPVERGGKRDKREAAASLERELVLWDIAELEHEIQASVRSAYAAAQAAQYELEQLRRYRELVQRIYDTVALSVEAGRSARLELERFEIELARLDLELAAARRAVDQTLVELAAIWGGTAEFDGVSPLPDAPHSIPPLAHLLPLLDSHPALERYEGEYEVLCARLDLEHANAVGDAAWFGGVSRLNEINETVFKVGVAWDLTTNDRNEGAISAAARRLEQVEDIRAEARLDLERELAALHTRADGALSNYRSYAESLLPAANEALLLTEEGYRYGKFELLDVLDAQRTVLELESEQTAALNELRMQLAEIEGLLNVSLAEPVEPVPPATLPIQTNDEGHKEHNHE